MEVTKQTQQPIHMRQIVSFALVYSIWCVLLIGLYFGVVLAFAHILDVVLPTIGDTPHTASRVSVSVSSFMHIYKKAAADSETAA